MPVRHKERHRTKRIGWLRAAVLGANDGIVSTASLVLGVAAAHGTRSNVLVAGVAGLVTGAMAMAAGEYVSVHSQADTEQAELKRERAELKADDKGEHKELMAIYVGRGLEARVVEQTDLLRVDGERFCSVTHLGHRLPLQKGSSSRGPRHQAAVRREQSTAVISACV